MIGALVILLLLFLITGIPIFVSLGLSSFLAVMFLSDSHMMVLIQRLFAGIDTFSLMALPLFILAANIMDRGGLSDRLLRFARALVGHLSGGIALTTQVSSMFFGALSGSSPATVVAIGKIMYPELLRGGYSKSFSGSLLASAGAVSLVIPPSITLIIFGTVTGVSISSLFIAGSVAGVVLGLSSIIYIYYYAKKNNLQKDKKASWSELLISFVKAWWSLLVPVIILGGIYSGIFSPTEAAGISAVYALVIGFFIYRELDLKKIYQICVDSGITSAQILVLVASAQVLGWVLTNERVPQMIAQFIAENITTGILFLLILNAILLLLGMFMDGVAAIIVTAPLIYPAAMNLGIDPVHLGVIMIANLAIGMYTPPFGINIFVGQSVTDTSTKEMIPGILRFLACNIAALLLITYIPEISLFLVDILNS
ncbi:TRAP transporter large permease [Lentibacillus amyloliquefaciens]|uniref:C4-dicarboxylate ABC transporter permease n=1 Tax=Lentibacillus amyloliquefaciens TaxID=1472767 RepID=A0A0U4EWL1_9BACI|nr:TRAP transporter large permease [Lentibacillus amyloliquefaciens]ALX47735.1 C4-dicarboxylate ABC transporter permease [Lentibacillus amyloliquefaciens]